jgi:pimeloyl-ACP methyl ester carboxylesterase
MKAKLVLTLGVMALTATAFAQEKPAPERTYTRSQITKSIADARKIVTPNGVEDLLEVDIGGTKQWLSIRSRDRRNPVLLMIHGGPASPEMPTSWWFQSGWEDYFTVVQWDQRGAGKTYNANDPRVIKPTLSLARHVADAGEVVQYLRKRFTQDKVFVLGHSFGSLIGLTLAHDHPEWLYAYIGMGQVISGREGERVGYELVLKTALKAGNQKAVDELKAIAPYPDADGSVPLAKINKQREWGMKYGGLSYGRENLDYYFALVKFSPEYTVEDMQAFDKGSALSLPVLLPELARFDFSDTTEFGCPILMFEGRHDYTTPSAVVEKWLQRVKAPSKKLVWFESSAHMVMVEEPGRMLVHLVQDALPYAQKSAR